MYSALSFQTFSLHKVAHLFSKLYLALLANCIWRSNFSLSMCSSQTWAFSSMSADDNMITSDISWYDHRWWYCKLWPYSHDVIFISFCADSSTSRYRVILLFEPCNNPRDNFLQLKAKICKPTGCNYILSFERNPQLSGNQFIFLFHRKRPWDDISLQYWDDSSWNWVQL